MSSSIPTDRQILGDIALRTHAHLNDWLMLNHHLFRERSLLEWADSAELQAGSVSWDHDLSSLHSNSFWRIFYSLLDFIFTRKQVAWASLVLILKDEIERETQRDRVIALITRARLGIDSEQGWHYNQLIPWLFHKQRYLKCPYEITSSTHICLNVLSDSRPLSITCSEPAFQASEKLDHNILVDDFVAVCRSRISQLGAILSSLNLSRIVELPDSKSDQEIADVFKEFDEFVKDCLKDTSGVPFRVKGARKADLSNHLTQGVVPFLAFAKYTALMTLVCPQWKRIVQIPHRGVVQSKAQPGGIAICETELSGEFFSENCLSHICDIKSSAMWPWQAMQIKEDNEREAVRVNAVALARLIKHEFNSNTHSPVQAHLYKWKIKKKISNEEMLDADSFLRFFSKEIQGIQGINDDPKRPVELSEDPISFITFLVNCANHFGIRKVTGIKSPSKSKEANKIKVPRIVGFVFAELIRNAVKIREIGSDESPASISVEVAEGSMEVKISNPASNDQFQKVQSILRVSIARKELFSDPESEGGLAMARSLAEHFNGSLKAEYDSSLRRLSIIFSIPLLQ